MPTGKAIRMGRILDKSTGKTIIVPMDHGVTLGPITGLESMQSTVGQIASGGADALVLHKGMVPVVQTEIRPETGLIVHLSAGTALNPVQNQKVLVTRVEEAVKLGADAVSVHLNVGNTTESEMLADCGRVAAQAKEWGMPLLTMVYARGQSIRSEYDADLVAHCARIGAELGADILKVNYTGDRKSFGRVVRAACGVPVVVAGGERVDSVQDFLTMTHDALAAGAAGLSVGRNVFQYSNPYLLCQVLRSVVHEGLSVAQALPLLHS